ncbi:uncharacterized protein LOC141588666 [Silene latifolia]|uniref:uncharacterized protein LOC141588666 n=1 Tax=Silene latifolia TaxID=37657 RepID=UPI003D77B75F
MNKNIPLVSAVLKSTYSREATVSAIEQHADQAFGPVSPVLKMYDSVQEIERLLVLGPTKRDVVGYLSLIKQFEEGLRFLTDNCGLAMQWMEDIVELIDEDVLADDRYVLNLNQSLRILKKLKYMEGRVRVSDGVLSDSFDKLEIEFRRMVKELPENIVELRTIVERLEANNDRFENCKTIYIDFRSSALNESDSAQKLEEYAGQWGSHMEFAIKRVLHTEFELCNTVFEKFGSNVSETCFAKIIEKSGFLRLLSFGML